MNWQWGGWGEGIGNNNKKKTSNAQQNLKLDIFPLLNTEENLSGIYYTSQGLQLNCFQHITHFNIHVTHCNYMGIQLRE